MDFIQEKEAFNFEELFELSPDLFCIVGFDGRLKKINSSVVKTIGYSFEELYACNLDDLIHPDDLAGTIAVRKKLKENHSVVNYENRYITKAGEVVWLSWTSKAAQKGKFIFGVAKNITARKKEDSHRISHMADLSQRNKNFQELSYTTSHNLRSPIDNILSIIELMDLGSKDEQNKELLDVLGNAAEQLKSKLSTYIDDLGKTHLVKVAIESIGFKSCLNEVTVSIKQLIETSNTTIKTDFSEAENVLFNKAYLESTFLNLVSNAIKYAKPSMQPQISIYSKIENDQVKLFVEDNGLGFDMSVVKDKIFGLHQTFHENTDSKGIGLYLVYTHITSLGGTIAVESELNKGTRFIISFSNNLTPNS